jgi:hypothetical protein
LGKLTWIHYGLMLLAGLAGFACSQEDREPKEVGTTQVELRSDFVLPEAPGASTALSAGKNSGHPDQSANPIPATQRIALSGLKKDSQDRAYRAVNRYEFLPALLKDSEIPKSLTQEASSNTDSWMFADKHRVRGGKGFGVAAVGMAPPGAVHPNDASFYVPTVALKPYSKPSEHLAPVAEPFKSRKPLVFHSEATGFAHAPQLEAMPTKHSSAFETRLTLSPIPETQVYLSSKPKTQVILAPGKNRLDLLNGNKNINRDRFDKLN